MRGIIDNVIFDTYEYAVKTLDDLIDIQNENGIVTLSTLYNLINMPYAYNTIKRCLNVTLPISDTINIDSATIEKVNTGYIITNVYKSVPTEKGVTKMIKGQGEMQESKEGSMRESNTGRGRFDLLPYEAMEALAIWYEEATNKYPERDWEKGMSVKDCINRMTRHALKASSGWTDEDHLAAVMWNAAAAITMMKRHPEYNDHKWLGKEKLDDYCEGRR